MENRMKKPLIGLLAFALAVTASVPAFTSAFAADRAQPAVGEPAALISTADTTWRYWEDDSLPITKPADGWNSDVSFDETGWNTGKGSFGAKKGGSSGMDGGYTIHTLLAQYLSGSSDDIPVYYFRTTFDLEDPSNVTALQGSLLYDDAAIVYVNGKKIAGFDDGEFDKNGYGGSNAAAPKTGKINFTDVTSLGLKAKDNLLAVELHQGRPSSSDIYLDFTSLKASSEEITPEAPQIDNLSFGIGADESQRNLTWYANSDKASMVQVAVKPEGFQKGDAFPSADAKTFEATREKSNIQGYFSNKATVTGLKENTQYLYRVGNDDKWSETYAFKTEAFGKNTSFRFLFAGDPQIGAGNGDVAKNSAEWGATLERAVKLFPDTSFILSAGDQINDKDSREESQYDGFLAPSVLKQYPLATNVGNHDSGSLAYTQHFNMPNVSDKGVSNNTGDGSGDYWFLYNGVLFLSLNSNNLSTAEHKAFMEQVLKEQEANANWTVVTFHHSIYSAANHATDKDIVDQRRPELSPIFSELGIDVVLMGHDHHYTRSYMMEGTTPVIPKGHDLSKGETPAASVTDPEEGQVLYLTTNSASGSKYYPFNSGAMLDYVAVRDQQNRQNITDIQVTENSFTITTYYSDQDDMPVLDTFTINRTPKAEDKAPVITLPGAENNKLTVGDKFDPMAGVSAQDASGNDLTGKITVSGTVDTAKAGTYTLTYTVADQAGNTAQAERTVTVEEKADSSSSVPSGNSSNVSSGTSSGVASSEPEEESSNSSSDNTSAGSVTVDGNSSSEGGSSPVTGENVGMLLGASTLLVLAGTAGVALRRRGTKQ